MRNHGDKMTQDVNSPDALWEGGDADRPKSGPRGLRLRLGRRDAAPAFSVSRQLSPPPSMPLGRHNDLSVAVDDRDHIAVILVQKHTRRAFSDCQK